MRKLSTAVLIAGVAFMTVVAGCGGGGGPTTPNKNVPGETIVTGRVVDDESPPHPLENITITMGSRPATTNSDGRFSIDLGSNVAVASLFASPADAVFSVNTSVLDLTNYPYSYLYYPLLPTDPNYDISVDVYSIDNYVASVKIPLNVYVAQGATVDLGNIYVPWLNPNNPPNPPILQ
jgi:hypothetical protein